MMERDERLEQLSEDVRMGIPVDMSEALEVIAYQERLKVERSLLPWYKKIFTR